MTEEQAPYTFSRMEGSATRPPVQDDWGWDAGDGEDENPLDKRHYQDNRDGAEVAQLRGEIRLLNAMLHAAQTPQDGQGHVKPAELLLDDVRAEFERAYANIPPILSMNWGFDVVAALLGVTR